MCPRQVKARRYGLQNHFLNSDWATGGGGLRAGVVAKLGCYRSGVNASLIIHCG